MSVRPPRRVPDAWGSGNIDALNYEVAQEQAATLGRLGGRLDLALQALARFDGETTPGDARADEREALLPPPARRSGTTWCSGRCWAWAAASR